MGYKFSFADNTAYTATDVNNITKRLVTEGVADSFQDGTPYNLSALNESGALLYTDGVVPETVSTLKVTDNGNGTVLIQPGAAFFSDGAVIEIDAGGHEEAYTPGVVNYVYLKNDLVVSNACYPVCSPEEPTGIFVPLAEISVDGVIADKRTYAKGKLPGYASNSLYTMKVSKYVRVKNRTCESIALNIGNNTYNFLLAVQRTIDSHECFGLYNFADNSYFSLASYSNSAGNITSTESLYLHVAYLTLARATVTQADGTVTLDITYSRDTALSDESGFFVELYLF